MPGDLKKLVEPKEDYKNPGRRESLDGMLPAVYNELRYLASSFLNREHAVSMQTTELVHEAYFRLTAQRLVNWENRGQFFAIAAQAMRRILIDAARERRSLKKGGEKVPIDEALEIPLELDFDLIDLDRALTELAQFDARQCRIVELKFFAGLTLEETAMALDISVSTVRREWAIAQAWLYQRINGR